MVAINTRDFGEIQVNEDSIYDFPEGIYGFENDKKFALFEKSFNGISFHYLQSLQNPIPCFLVFDPWDLVSNYTLDISSEDSKSFESKDMDDLFFLVIASVSSSVEEMSFNIKSPIALNSKTKEAKQIILQNPDYSVRYQPFLKNRKAGTSC